MNTEHNKLKAGYFIADGSATGKIRCGAAVVWVTEAGEVWQCALRFGCVVSAFWTEMVALTWALQYTETAEQIIFSDCKSALLVVRGWSPREYRGQCPVKRWVYNHLNTWHGSGAMSAKLWWLKGHTGRNDWVFPLQNYVDLIAGQQQIMGRAIHQQWKSSAEYTLHHVEKGGFCGDVEGHLQAVQEAEQLRQLYQGRADRIAWYPAVENGGGKQTWKSQWLSQRVEGPPRWPFKNGSWMSFVSDRGIRHCSSCVKVF